MARAFTERVAAAPAAALAARIPASLFSIELGLAWLGAAWRAAASAYKTSAWIADALLALSAVLWIALLVAQIVKTVAARERMLAELRDPVQGSLASLVSASLLTLAAGLAAGYQSLAAVLFWIGAAGQLCFAVYMVGRWLSTSVEPRLVSPAMYVPAALGGLLAAAAAGSVGLTDAAWLFFGAGAFSWIIVAATLFSRYMSAGELPLQIRPLLGLELAPPAVALVAWQALAGPYPDLPSRILLGFSVFVALVLLRLAVRLRAAPFGVEDWAYAFPAAALSTAALRLAAVAPASVAASLALPLFVVANALVVWIAFKTVSAALRETLLPLQ